jgi:hypothetical protein
VPQGKHQTDMKYDRRTTPCGSATANRVIFRKDGRWGEIAQKDGLLNLPCAAIGIEADGDIWVGYQSKAAAFIHNPASSHPVVHNFHAVDQ